MATKGVAGNSGGKAKTIWLDKAIADVDRITDLIAAHSIPASNKIKAVIWDNVRLLSAFSRIGKMQLDGKSRLWTARHGAGALLIYYSIIYDEVVVITSVKHSKEHK